MNTDPTQILEQIKNLSNSALPLVKALGNLMILILDFTIKLIREGLSKL